MWSLTLAGVLIACWSLTAGYYHTSDEPRYRALGNGIVLTPGPVNDPITNITWKHGSDLAVQWDGDGIYTSGHFKDRIVLNVSTAALTITGLTRNDSGSFTAEINNRVAATTRLQVIARVSKPTVSKYCDAEMNYCAFTCEGNTTDAEPIEFEWFSIDYYFQTPVKNVHNITEDWIDPWFHCILSNPVSSSSSDRVFNPLRPRDYASIVIYCIAAMILLMLVVIIIVIVIKCRKRFTTVI